MSCEYVDSFFRAQDFRELLRREYQIIKQRREAYSMGAFARDLGLNRTTLSGVLSGRDGISQKTANAIAKRLSYTKEQAEFFVNLVESRHARTALARRQAKARLDRFRTKERGRELADESFEVLEKWYYPAALELITQKRNINEDQIAISLQVTKSQAQDAIRCLLKINAIKESQSGYVRRDKFLCATRKTPASTLRQFHKQIMERASTAIDVQPIETRKFKSSIISIHSDRIEEARAWLDKMQEEFVSEFANTTDTNMVYALGLQLFRLDGGKQDA